MLPDTAVEELRTAAEDQLWHAPHKSLGAARAAYTASARLSADMRAECTVTLGAALNATGRFAEAASTLQTLEPSADQLPIACLIRCYTELAIAYAYLGQFAVAENALQQARQRLPDSADPLAGSYYTRAAGILQREQGHYSAAGGLLQRATETFRVAGCGGEAALTLYDLALTTAFIDSGQALDQLAVLNRMSVPGDAAIHWARCDYIRGFIEDTRNHYAESATLYQRARSVFAQAGLIYWVALCDLGQGIAHYRLNNYDDAQRAYRRARGTFSVLMLSGYGLLCDFNTAIVLYGLNNYSESLALYERVIDTALAEGRLMRAARCHIGMALCYDRLGQYDRALILQERARQAFLDNDSPIDAAIAEENLAGTYRRLGRHAEALRHYRAAREIFTQRQTPVYVAECDTHLADLHLALRQYAEASACLARARAVYEQQGMPVHIATCDREIARAWLGANPSEHFNESLALLMKARHTLLDARLLVDGALCDLASGEAQLYARQPELAAQSFAAALSILEPAFPDEAWRGHYGVGHCALMQDRPEQALQHWLAAIQLLQRVRSTLLTEQLSGGFFADHRPLYEDALRLALKTAAVETAIIVANASKAQMHASWNILPSWRNVMADDDYAQQLLEREAGLRAQIDTLRRGLQLLQTDDAGPILCNAELLKSDQPLALARLAELSRDYEQTIEQLRLLQSVICEHSSQLLSIETLRANATEWLAGQWACLTYYLLDEAIVVFYLDARRLTVHTHPLDAYDRAALRQCTHPATDYREQIYRHTLRGYSTPDAPSRIYLQHLSRILIPPEVAELPDDALLIIAPHGLLHQLPFQALITPDDAWLARRPICYIPSLSALNSLFGADRSFAPNDQRILICGLSDYGLQARSLPHAEHEIATLHSIWGERLDSLWGSAATREALLRLNRTGQLMNYAVIHFTAHAVLDPLAPSHSRVLLADDSLTFADILNLRLRANVVTLSACDSASGATQPGDEVMALAQAFLSAGARAVVASLWPVEDEAASEFMQRFYRHFAVGASVARSLRATQLEMDAAGYTPYQWAAFKTIGLPNSSILVAD